MAADPSVPSRRSSEAITLAGRDLSDLLGTTTLTGAFLLSLDGSLPDQSRLRVVDAILVSIMDHGITPSSLATRLVVDGAPESLSGAVSAGLLAVGSRFLGTVEDAAAMLSEIVERAGPDAGRLQAAASEVVGERVLAGTRIPGLGHNLHETRDPRVDRLVAIAKEEGVASTHVAAFECVPEAAAEQLGKVLIPNAAGAIGAILRDLGYSRDVARGFALVARCAGLVSHAIDERREPMARGIWQAANAASP
jgi:citrate synthase